MRGSDRAVEAAIGYAASPRGNGVVYARLTAAGIHQILRLTFRVAASGQQTDRASGVRGADGGGARSVEARL